MQLADRADRAAASQSNIAARKVARNRLGESRDRHTAMGCRCKARTLGALNRSSSSAVGVLGTSRSAELFACVNDVSWSLWRMSPRSADTMVWGRDSSVPPLITLDPMSCAPPKGGFRSTQTFFNGPVNDSRRVKADESGHFRPSGLRGKEALFVHLEVTPERLNANLGANASELRRDKEGHVSLHDK